MTEPVDVISDTTRAAVLLHPTRLRILEQLAEPASAAVIASKLELPRQLVNYHLRELEAQRLVTLVEERKRGSVTERILSRTAESYAIAPQALGAIGKSEPLTSDRLSSAHQVAMASRVMRELSELRAGAAAAKKSLATFSLEFDVRFADAAARSRFAQELSDAVAELIKKHHDDRAANGRTFHWYLGAYPKPKTGRSSRR